MRSTLLFTVSLLASTGCASSNGILTIESGSPVGSSGRTALYAVHIGERPTLKFGWKLGHCDYAIAHVEGADLYDDCGPPVTGKFEWSMTFDHLAPAESPLRLTVSGYSQQQKRDLMPVHGHLVESESPLDAVDILIASASVMIEVYQSQVEVAVPTDGPAPDWALTRLIIHPDNGRSCRISHSGASGPGFSVNGPDSKHQYIVRYQPRASEVNHEGLTRAELILADETGATRSIATTFATP